MKKVNKGKRPVNERNRQWPSAADHFIRLQIMPVYYLSEDSLTSFGTMGLFSLGINIMI